MASTAAHPARTYGPGRLHDATELRQRLEPLVPLLLRQALVIFAYAPGQVVWFAGRYWSGHVRVVGLAAGPDGRWYWTRSKHDGLGMLHRVHAGTFEWMTRPATVAA